jgi:hypothetical protein
VEQYRAAASELRYNNIQNQNFYYDYGQIRRKKTPPDKNDNDVIKEALAQLKSQV